MNYPIIFRNVPQKIADLYKQMELSNAMFGGIRGSSHVTNTLNDGTVTMVQKSLIFLNSQCDQSKCLGNHKVMTK